VVECLWDEEAGVANRAADALERASSRRPEILRRWKHALLDRMLDARENKLRWNLALMIYRTPLDATETARAAAVLRSWLDDKSSIVKTSAMHGLAGLTRWDSSMLTEVLDMLRVLSRSGTPAMRARGRILLTRMEAGRELPVITGELSKIVPRGLYGEAEHETSRGGQRLCQGPRRASLEQSPGDKLAGQRGCAKTHMIPAAAGLTMIELLPPTYD
jgi:hypothetical protein